MQEPVMLGTEILESGHLALTLDRRVRRHARLLDSADRQVREPDRSRHLLGAE
jgi:hypothetical protein